MMNFPDRAGMIATVILSAGRSERMGKQDKLMLLYQEKPLIRIILEKVLAHNFLQVIAVVGRRREQIEREIASLPVEIARNTAHKQELSSSIRAGILTAEANDPNLMIKGYMFFLGDMPLIRYDTIKMLIHRFCPDKKKIVAPVMRGRRGNPVIFDRFYREELTAMSGDRGGGQVIKNHPRETVLIETADTGIFYDVDTWEDYSLLKKKVESV
ncbi:MAG: hypothetical protein B6244_01850 [Candidatus Cloacimonetes bacterium 4572_55]|nr:MAG: hypothetical protein B6244_01850 [Candidatus Cloacimonetes bacterium 4572_55]